MLGVGIFPGSIHPQHPLFAFTAFVAVGLAVLLSAWVTPQPLRVIIAVMGTISLSFTLASVFLPEWAVGPPGAWRVERWMVYPVLLWLVGFGGWLGGRQPREQAPAPAPRFPPRPPRPATGTGSRRAAHASNRALGGVVPAFGALRHLVIVD